MSHGSTARNTRTLPVKLSTRPPGQLSAPALAATRPRASLRRSSRSPHARPQAIRCAAFSRATRPLFPPQLPRTAPRPSRHRSALPHLHAACAAGSPKLQTSSSADQRSSRTSPHSPRSARTHPAVAPAAPAACAPAPSYPLSTKPTSSVSEPTDFDLSDDADSTAPGIPLTYLRLLSALGGGPCNSARVTPKMRS